MSKEIEAIGDHILFEFVEDVGGGGFLQQSGQGLLIAQGHEKQLDTCRWVRILSMGPEASRRDYDLGDIVLVENLKWTNMFMLAQKGQHYWQTTEEHILAKCDPENPPSEIASFL